jgi:uncharacterized protein (DUF983 family)
MDTGRNERELAGSAVASTWSNHDAHSSSPQERDVLKAASRGARLCCPNCGARKMFTSYLKVAEYCPACGEALHHHRADDAPPYFTMFIVGHIILSLLMTVEVSYAPPVWLHLVIWLPLTAVLCLALLPSVKGIIVAVQWAQRMHGFGGEEEISLVSKASAEVR